MNANKAPDFTTSVVLANGNFDENFNFYEAIKGKYALLFFYPLDFTFVCPSELIALNHRMKKFKSLGVEVITVSVDSHFTHLAWRNTPVDKGGIGLVDFIMASDLTHRIASSYKIEVVEDGVALRGAFLIDNQGIIFSEIITDYSLGRNIDEILRLFEARQLLCSDQIACLAN